MQEKTDRKTIKLQCERLDTIHRSTALVVPHAIVLLHEPCPFFTFPSAQIVKIHARVYDALACVDILCPSAVHNGELRFHRAKSLPKKKKKKEREKTKRERAGKRKKNIRRWK